jgi:DNA/RNA endonuclease YhcR with UshA esterase domain
VLKTNVNKDFQIFFSNPELISEDSATEMFEGKTIEIKGDVGTYKDVTQIKVSSMNQIEFSTK